MKSFYDDKTFGEYILRINSIKIKRKVSDSTKLKIKNRKAELREVDVKLAVIANQEHQRRQTSEEKFQESCI